MTLSQSEDQALTPIDSITFNLGDNDFSSPEESMEYLALMRDLKLREERLKEQEEQERRWVQRKLDLDSQMLELGLTHLTFPDIEDISLKKSGQL